jgi:exopolysaccharide biosynthesis polyprenyl glycosylphosphotransferase
MTTQADTAVLLDPGAVRVRGLQRSEHRLLLMAGDVACAGAAVLLSLWAWSITTGYPFDAAFLRRSAAWLLLVPLWTILVASSRRLPAALSLGTSVQCVLAAAAVLLAMYSAAYFYAPRQALPRLPALYFLWEAILLTIGWRVVYLRVFTAAGFRRRAIVIGTGPAAARIITLLRELSPDVEVIAAIADGSDRVPLDVPIHPTADLDPLLSRAGVSEIVVTSALRSPDLVQVLLRCQERGVPVVPMPIEYEQLLMRVPVAYLPGGWMFTSLSESVRTRDASLGLKRSLDIVGGLAGMVALGALLPVVAAMIWIDSGRPIFYRQTRLGLGGRGFRVIKFRTMSADAEENGPRWAGEDDSRVTRVGRWLRRSRLDELPQVVNVVRGDMSLVGPRPERPEFIERLEQTIPVYRSRLMVRPGLTGWAQVNTPYAASAEDASLKLEYDLYYIKHRSFLFDLWIVMKTASTLLTMSGR